MMTVGFRSLRSFSITCPHVLLLVLLLVGHSFGKFDHTAAVYADDAAATTDGASSSVNEATLNADGSYHVSSSSSNENDKECVDVFEDCEAYEVNFDMKNACIRDFAHMQKQCRQSCHLCNNVRGEWATNVYSEDAQHVTGMERAQILEYLEKVDKYMYETVYVEPQYESVREDCKNRDALCLFWASVGECTNNPNFMEKMCAPSCMSCDKLSFDMRCPFNKTDPRALNEKGQLNEIFERIVTDPQFEQYQPTILSRPQNNSTDTDIQDGPWVVYLDDFLSAKECDELIELGGLLGYERSRDVGDRQFDGTYSGVESTGRTSSNAWCTEECYSNATTMAVHERIENLIQIPQENYEHLQLLFYEKDQFYEQHHDFIAHHKDRYQGVRVLTVFLYLNDVPKGGGTNFPFLDEITVYPKRGRALIWPSVLDGHPNAKDRRTEHQALPVEEGVKYGANAWVHQRDFKTPWKVGCT